jgi:hypothetical protein
LIRARLGTRDAAAEVMPAHDMADFASNLELERDWHKRSVERSGAVPRRRTGIEHLKRASIFSFSIRYRLNSG